MADDAVTRAQWGHVAGLNLAGMVRMSHELPDPLDDDIEPAGRPRTGGDIKGRDVQQEDCAAYVTGRGGTYVHTYEEPDTSAWKRKRVRLPDGTTGWRVSRPVFEAALRPEARRRPER